MALAKVGPITNSCHSGSYSCDQSSGSSKWFGFFIFILD